MVVIGDLLVVSWIGFDFFFGCFDKLWMVMVLCIVWFMV